MGFFFLGVAEKRKIIARDVYTKGERNLSEGAARTRATWAIKTKAV